MSVVSKRGFDAFACLIELDLANNFLNSISFLEPLKNLQCLNLKGNKIHSIDEPFCLPELLKLNLAENGLEKVEKIAIIFSNLSELDLSHNLIQQFTELNFITDLNLLSELKVSGNPFQKDSNNFQIFLLNSGIVVIDGIERPVSRMPLSEGKFCEEEEDLWTDDSLEKQFMEVALLESQHKSIEIRFRDVSQRVESDLNFYQQNLQRKKWEFEEETKQSDIFREKVLKIKSVPNLVGGPGIEESLSGSGFEKGESGIKENTVSEQLDSTGESVFSANEIVKERSSIFRIKTLKTVLNFRKNPNLKDLQNQTNQLKKMYNLK